MATDRIDGGERDDALAMNPAIVISYSRDDSLYVHRLAGHLQQSGLPVWFDRHMAWGEPSYVRTIEKHIATAAGLIVIMSPASHDNDWVEREILEGQRCDRVFLPILLAGHRHFLLASTLYFDARHGELPGERELRQLRAMVAPHPPSSPRPRLHLPAPAEAAAAPAPAPASSLGKLAAYLAGGELVAADILTTSLLLGEAGGLDAGWIRAADRDRLPPDLLARIDRHWSAATGGCHGFAAQLARCPAAPPRARPGSTGDFRALAVALGWQPPTGLARRYGEFAAGDHPCAYYPTLRNPQSEGHASWYEEWCQTAMAVHLRLRAWRSLH